MKTYQHALGTLYVYCLVKAKDQTVEQILRNWRKDVPLIMAQDAVRCFPFATGFDGEELLHVIPETRPVCHFEVNPATGEASWMKMWTRDQLKCMDAKLMATLPKHFAGPYNQPGVGDMTSLDAFLEHNRDAEEDVLRCSYLHLLEDFWYDILIRFIINCTHAREDGTFDYMGFKLDKAEARKYISIIEDIHSLAIMKLLAEKFGINVDQKFIDSYIKKPLYEAYSKQMADSTWKYVSLPAEDLTELVKMDQAVNHMEAWANYVISQMDGYKA